MWIFRLVPESMPAMFVIIAAMVLNFSPQGIIWSGFGSDSLFLALSLFGIGCVLIKSRFFYRLATLMLYYLPSSHSVLQKMLFATGAVMTPVISVQSSRVALMAPLLDDLLLSGGIAPQSPAANALASAAFNGCILLSTVFLTGKSSNAILFAMLSEQGGTSSSWFQWLLAASFPGALLVALFFAMQRSLFNQKNTLNINKFRLKRELRALGSFSFEERAALTGLATLIAGLAFASWLHLSNFWICLVVFFVLFSSGSLSLREFRRRINWTFLFYMGGIIGIMRYIQSIGVDQWLAKNLYWINEVADGNIALFILCVYIVSWLCGFIFGTMTAPAILFTLFLPIANQAGVNGWLIAFVILMATEAWVFPYQSSYYLCFEEMLNKNRNFKLNSVMYINIWLTLGKLGVILASIPFWRWSGII